MSTISVVIPSLDDAEFLAACLRAISAQTRAADEVIVVDNGSTDDTAAVARAAGARVLVEPHRGIWPATATGFDAARGEILARLDADSVPAPDWLAEIERRMSARDRPTVVTNGGTFYGRTALVRWIARNIYIGGYFTVIGALLGHPPIFGSNYAMRADAWRRLRHLVHRDRADVHDDLDLAWWMQPGMTVVRDRGLAVEVSARPFDSAAGLWRRVRMAFHTMSVESREWPPLTRRAERRRAPAWVWEAPGLRETAVDRDTDGDEALPA
ncbi:glycosyltransferase family A protein [Agromyces sp. H3Y2-19a]|jgi:glycosyltransferase involved in cell wall biosynthesis|uniref:glycosyltransferase family 2 protein n=1 Tax=Agromyces TaxID=33877 RepID=UPI001E5AD9F7|nr:MULTISPECIES: glycosyltransferase family A protein [Agromyces]MCD5347522.1 glycosyltransferase family 2 protein [Agromyces sp. S2-1-8]MDF0514907.1 glycosyltransferase family A protein [Agromyces chromiiresistens]